METDPTAPLTSPRTTRWVSYYWLFLAAVFCVAAVRFSQSIDPDLWWHLRAGNWMIDHRQLLQVDLFSSTRFGSAWQHPDWLAEILMAAVYRLGGLKGVFLFFAGVYTAGFALILRAGKTHRVVTLAVGLLAFLASEIAAAPKPAMFSFLLFTVYLVTLERAAFRVQRIVLPLVMLLWANLHGGFFMGFILLGSYWLYPIVESAVLNGLVRKTRPVIPPEVRRHAGRFAALVGLALLAALINPYGLRNLTYLASSTAVQTGAMRSLIVEWLPPDFGDPGMRILLGVICVSLLLFYLAPRRHILGTLLSVLFLGLTLIHARMVLFWAPVTQFFLSQVLYRELPAPGSEEPWVKRAAAGVAVAIVLLFSSLILTTQTLHERERAQYPATAADYLVENGEPGNIFTLYHWGGYLGFRAPEHPVFIDGRADLFGDEIIFDQYLKVLDVRPGWAEVLSRVETRYLLIDPAQRMAVELIETGCAPAYRDEVSVLFDLHQCQAGDLAGR